MKINIPDQLCAKDLPFSVLYRHDIIFNVHALMYCRHSEEYSIVGCKRDRFSLIPSSYVFYRHDFICIGSLIYTVQNEGNMPENLHELVNRYFSTLQYSEGEAVRLSPGLASSVCPGGGRGGSADHVYRAWVFSSMGSPRVSCCPSPSGGQLPLSTASLSERPLIRGNSRKS